jgi:hypothetical protein
MFKWKGLAQHCLLAQGTLPTDRVNRTLQKKVIHVIFDLLQFKTSFVV